MRCKTTTPPTPAGGRPGGPNRLRRRRRPGAGQPLCRAAQRGLASVLRKHAAARRQPARPPGRPAPGRAANLPPPALGPAGAYPPARQPPVPQLASLPPGAIGQRPGRARRRLRRAEPACAHPAGRGPGALAGGRPGRRCPRQRRHPLERAGTANPVHAATLGGRRGTAQPPGAAGGRRAARLRRGRHPARALEQQHARAASPAARQQPGQHPGPLRGAGPAARPDPGAPIGPLRCSLFHSHQQLRDLGRSANSRPSPGAGSAASAPVQARQTGTMGGMSIPASFIQGLLARIDLGDIVCRYVTLKKGGANLMGLCPFHEEKSPSFSVSPAKQFYHCFGCGKSGDAISFLMAQAGLDFVEAVQDLARQAGLQVPEDNSSPADKERPAAARPKQARLSEGLEKAAAAYRQHLHDTPHAIAYFKSRGVSGAIAERYGLGYAPDGWRSLASCFARYDDPLLAESGLVIVNAEDGGKRYDRFRNRVMFPIRNVKGECIGFGGRVLGQDKPKYLNSPETPVFHKGHELYGLFEARSAIHEQGYALVTEGYMDVVALAQRGFPNTVATLGT